MLGLNEKGTWDILYTNSSSLEVSVHICCHVVPVNIPNTGAPSFSKYYFICRLFWNVLIGFDIIRGCFWENVLSPKLKLHYNRWKEKNYMLLPVTHLLAKYLNLLLAEAKDGHILQFLEFWCDLISTSVKFKKCPLWCRGSCSDWQSLGSCSSSICVNLKA